MFSRRCTQLAGQSKLLRLIHNKNQARMTSSVKVKVKQGTVVGGEAKLPNGSPYYFFKGIPYAVPPVGELRFQSPIPLTNFNSPEIECKVEGDVCSQKDPLSGELIGSENCLFLNVYTPRRRENSNQGLPVMVFIHGGGYLFGYGNSNLYKPLYLMQEDVVVVTLNYRLGAFGFLCLPEANIPGNAGLKDQYLAMQWVTNNISQFGGDPQNITLFGESAGAACVHLHFLSAKSRTLFHKAIVQSGTANMPWAMKANMAQRSVLFAKAMGCQSNDQVECAKFLRASENFNGFWKNLIGILTPEERRRDLPMPVGPIVESEDIPDAVVVKEPLNSMTNNKDIDIPLMMGYNSGEGLLMLSNVIKKLDEYERDFARLIPRNVNLHPDDPESQVLANRIRDFYMKGAKLDHLDNLDGLKNLISDFMFIIDAYAAAEIHSRNLHKSPLYFYRFDFVGELGFYKRLFGFEHLEGACHGDDLFYLFQSVLADEPWPERDKKMVLTMCKMWANFAKYGNPTPRDGDVGIDFVWEPVRKVNNNDEKFVLNALVIDENRRMVENPGGDRIEFWRSVYRKYNNTERPPPSKL